MLNQTTLTEAFELALSRTPAPHDYHDTEHSAEDQAAFERGLRRRSPAEETERRVIASLLTRRP